MTDVPSREALSRYGLDLPPFGHDVALEDLFYYPHLQQCLELLIQLAEYSDRLILVSGPEGSGKTSLLRLLLDQAREHWHRCVYQGSEQIRPEELFAAIADCIDPDGEAQAQSDQLPQLLQALHLAGRRPLLIIDDAHRLPKESLRELVAFARAHTADGPLLPMVLFTRPGLSLRIGQSTTLDIQELALPALDVDEARVFLTHRLHIAGSASDLPLDSDQLEQIHEDANGYPGALLELAGRALFDETTLPVAAKPEPERPIPAAPRAAPAGRVRTANSAMPWGKIAAVLVLSALLATALVFQDRINQLLAGGEAVPVRDPDESRATSAEPNPLKVRVRPPVAPFAQQPRLLEPQKPALTEPPAPVTVQAPPPQDPPGKPWTEPTSDGVEVQPLPAAPPLRVAPIKSVAQSAASKTEEPRPEPPPLDTLVVANEPPPEPVAKTTATVEAVEKPAKLVLEPPPEPEQTATPKSPKSQPESKPRAAPKNPTPALNPQASPAAPVAKSASGLRDEGWLRERDPKHWALQVLAVAEEASMHKFVRDKGLAGKVSYYRGLRNGKPWYSLLYGDFESREAALRAAAELPRLGTSPWPRSFASVQAQIQR